MAEEIRKKWMAYDVMGLGPEDFADVTFPSPPERPGGTRFVLEELEDVDSNDNDGNDGNGGEAAAEDEAGFPIFAKRQLNLTTAVPPVDQLLLPLPPPSGDPAATQPTNDLLFFAPSPPTQPAAQVPSLPPPTATAAKSGYGALFPQSPPLSQEGIGIGGVSLTVVANIDEDYKVSASSGASACTLDGVVKLNCSAADASRREHNLRVGLEGKFDKVIGNGEKLSPGLFRVICDDGKAISAVKYQSSEAFNVVKAQSKLSFQGSCCRVVVQVASNPAFSFKFTSCTLGVSLPPGIFKRESLKFAPGCSGNWTGTSVVQIKLDGDLTCGEKRAVQMQLDMVDENDGRSKLEGTNVPLFLRMYSNDSLTTAAINVNADGGDTVKLEILRRLRVQVRC